MSETILYWTILASQVLLGAAMVAATTRMIRGPRAQDRILALDAFYVAAMMMLVLFGIRVGTNVYFEAALVIGILGFVSTVALAKFLMRGEVNPVALIAALAISSSVVDCSPFSTNGALVVANAEPGERDPQGSGHGWGSPGRGSSGESARPVRPE